MKKILTDFIICFCITSVGALLLLMFGDVSKTVLLCFVIIGTIGGCIEAHIRRRNDQTN